MINGDPIDFVDTLYTGQDISFVFHDVKLWFQGYSIGKKFHIEITQYEPPKDGYIWVYDGDSPDECKEAFLTAPLFDGKTFWEVESEIEWIDD